jgi:hypothetical protein
MESTPLEISLKDINVKPGVPLLVAGHVGSGKTTVGRALMEQGRVDAAVELDEIGKWVNPEPFSKGGYTIEFEEWRKRTCRLAGRMISRLSDLRVVVTGVWPWESGTPLLLTALQKFETLQVQPVSQKEADRRIVLRGGNAGSLLAMLSKQKGGWEGHVSSSLWRSPDYILRSTREAWEKEKTTGGEESASRVTEEQVKSSH